MQCMRRRRSKSTFQTLRQKYFCRTQLWREPVHRATKGETGFYSNRTPGSSQVQRTEIGYVPYFCPFFMRNKEKIGG
jgi:hypothetical protein